MTLICSNCKKPIKECKCLELKWNYTTEKEAKEFTPDEFDLQMVLGIQTCKTKKDVMDILKDVRQHERIQKHNCRIDAKKKLKDSAKHIARDDKHWV